MPKEKTTRKGGKERVQRRKKGKLTPGATLDLALTFRARPQRPQAWPLGLHVLRQRQPRQGS